jgi:hypothetical protein
MAVGTNGLGPNPSTTTSWPDLEDGDPARPCLVEGALTKQVQVVPVADLAATPPRRQLLGEGLFKCWHWQGRKVELVSGADWQRDW